MHNKRKIINDPVYGFITIPSELVYEVIQHPYFQRLRRINQLGMAEFVYPGAKHTRFQHALGAMHLMGQALQTLKSKNLTISNHEIVSAQIAILLHDLGHGPFSHVLEHHLLEKIPHEWLSEQLMQEINKDLNGALDLAVSMFNGTYERPFFHQLVSSQLDMDRMDYLRRDSFFTGVVEGTIGVERIIKMLQVIDNQLVVEEKGLLSVENFLNARRLMYWQVYLHKTAIAAESMLVLLLSRVRFLLKNGDTVPVVGPLKNFLISTFSQNDFIQNSSLLALFASLDDTDIWMNIKEWARAEDGILKDISSKLLERKLYKIELSNEPILASRREELSELLLSKGVSEETLPYYLREGSVSNKGYIPENSHILIVRKDGTCQDMADASDLPTIKALSHIVKKYYLCYTNPLSL